MHSVCLQACVHRHAMLLVISPLLHLVFLCVTCMSACLFVCTCLSICLPVCLSVCVSVSLSDSCNSSFLDLSDCMCYLQCTSTCVMMLPRTTRRSSKGSPSWLSLFVSSWQSSCSRFTASQSSGLTGTRARTSRTPSLPT